MADIREQLSIMWPDRRLADLFGIEHPIVLAPMAGPGTAELAIAVAEAGGLGSLPTATSSPEQIRKDLGVIRQRTSRPLNLNFFTHKPPQPDAAREAKWKARLAAYYRVEWALLGIMWWVWLVVVIIKTCLGLVGSVVWFVKWMLFL